MASSPSSGPGPDKPLRVMPWWLVLAGLVLALGAGWLVTAWLLAVADPGTTRAELRIDAIRTGLTVVAGTGGAVAVVLGARRQWLNERAQRHQEWVDAQTREYNDRVQAHQESVAAAAQEHQRRLALQSEQDATERRVTELFARAVDHLGSEKPAVRLGGLYALERLATQHPQHRQSIVDVVCAYLRMPAEAREEAGPEPARAPELQVRSAAHRVLRRHLDAGDAESFWPDVRIDLAGAVLDGFEARGCTFTHADFTAAVFHGPTDLAGATFSGWVSFKDATFRDGVSFDRTEWQAPARFARARFTGRASFGQALMTAGASFANASFDEGASFHGAAFDDSVKFDNGTFGSDSSFSGSRFGRSVSFEHVTFTGAASYRNATFSDIALFRWARFLDAALFDGARFEGAANFARATFYGQVTIEAPIRSRPWYFENARAAVKSLRQWPPGWREKAVDDEWVTIVPLADS